MKLKIIKKYDLSEISEGWEGCFLNLSPLTVADLEQMTSLKDIDIKSAADNKKSYYVVIDLLKSHYIDGMVINEKGEKVALPVEEFGDLPVEIIMGAISFLSQGLVKSVEMLSKPSSEVAVPPTKP